MIANATTVLAVTLAAGLVLGACAPRRNIDLVRAETAYREASADPTVRLYESPRHELTSIQSRESDRGIVLTIPDVLFDVDKADLKVGAQRDLAAIAMYLKDRPGQKVLIEGHTDSTGTTAHNHELSLRRSTAVETFFLKNGVDPERFEVRGLGENLPIASNETSAGRQQNRRVEIVVLNGGDTTVRTEQRVIELRR